MNSLHINHQQLNRQRNNRTTPIHHGKGMALNTVRYRKWILKKKNVYPFDFFFVFAEKNLIR